MGLRVEEFGIQGLSFVSLGFRVGSWISFLLGFGPVFSSLGIVSCIMQKHVRV